LAEIRVHRQPRERPAAGRGEVGCRGETCGTASDDDRG